MDRALAASGVLVVAIDMTHAPEAPYPACVQDANYGVRWLKSKAASWNGDPSKLGIYGSSSGGHVAELLAMRPHDPRYNAIPLAGAPNARRHRRLCRDAIADQRSLRALQERREPKRDGMMKNHHVLQAVGDDSREQPAGDPRAQGKGHARAAADHAGRARRQRAAGDAGEIRGGLRRGGSVDYHLFEGSEHEWVAEPGPQTDRAREMVKAFIARQLKSK